VRSLIAALLLLVSTGAAAEEFKRGETVDGVACAEHPEITYAYYLPTRYTPQQHWPVLFVFDPRQRGAYAAELFREPAEQFGCGRPPAAERRHSVGFCAPRLPSSSTGRASATIKRDVTATAGKALQFLDRIWMPTRPTA